MSRAETTAMLSKLVEKRLKNRAVRHDRSERKEDELSKATKYVECEDTK